MITVTPIADTRDHDSKSTVCACGPRVMFENGEMIIIHNSFDGREAAEEAQELINRAVSRLNGDQNPQG